MTVQSLVNIALAVIIAPVMPFPSPSADLREIGRARATLLCATLREGVAPALNGLQRNDELIGVGHKALAKLAQDSTNALGSSAVEFDRQYLGSVQTRLSRNIRLLRAILGDRKHLPFDPTAMPAAESAALQTQIEMSVDSQDHALNLLS